MPFKKIVLLLAGLTIIASTAGGVVYHLNHQVLEDPGVRWAPVPGRVEVEIILPERVLDYTSEALPVLQEELTKLPPDTSFGRRRYVAPDGGFIDLSVVMMGGDHSSIHRPQSCIPSQGWSILEENTDNVGITSPEPYALTFNRMLNSKRFMRDGREQEARSYYLYWFVSKDRITHRRDERILSLAGKMLRSGEVERWAYISVFSAFPPGYDDLVYDRMLEFMGAAVPEFQLVHGAALAKN